MPPRPLPSASLTNFQILRRMIGWGTWMAFLWGWFQFIFGGGLSMAVFWLPENPNAPVQHSESESGLGLLFMGVLFYLSIWFTCLRIAGGAITGCVIGYCAPASDGKMPWKSKFFSEVGLLTFGVWNYPNVVAVPFIAFILSGYRIFDHCLGYIILSLIIISFLLSLANGLNKGLKELAPAVETN